MNVRCLLRRDGLRLPMMGSLCKNGPARLCGPAGWSDLEIPRHRRQTLAGRPPMLSHWNSHPFLDTQKECWRLIRTLKASQSLVTHPTFCADGWRPCPTALPFRDMEYTRPSSLNFRRRCVAWLGFCVHSMHQ